MISTRTPADCPLSDTWAPRGYAGTCPNCHKTVRVRNDGKLARHKNKKLSVTHSK